MSDIVVFLRSHFRYGDQIVAFPTLYQLAQWWPRKRLRVVSKYDVGSFYRDLPWVDEFVMAPDFRRQLASLPRHAMMSVNLHHTSERFGLINLLRRPPLRMGYRHARLTDAVWTHHHVKDESEYIGLSGLRMLSTYRPVDPETAARQCFGALAARVRGRVAPADVVFIPGGGSGAFKRWDIGRYIALAGLLKPALGPDARFTFVLGPDEARELALLRALARPDFRIEHCRSVPELAAMMLPARLIVANDCGPSHIAQAAGVPYVGVFNEPNPEWFWRRDHARDVVPDDGSDNIDSIVPHRVRDACLAALAAYRARPARQSATSPHGAAPSVHERGRPFARGRRPSALGAAALRARSL
ncbi:glycosyltransferase family 9 protein [Achromobacter sp. Marseille-Q4962]|uniref:glycosyltransferase family 9 protein n=1 Tax=Achromobacter sp. Marseille-Q4962 TaxID=2942202 RepID=UPI00207436A2|nr:glycosyltransferase family 9 protein [Achromobacter sp. Marseille-Q4962]